MRYNICNDCLKKQSNNLFKLFLPLFFFDFRHADCGGEASESQQSSDEYHLYYYDPRARLPSPDHPQQYVVEEQWFSVAVKKIEDSLEVCTDVLLLFKFFVF